MATLEQIRAKLKAQENNGPRSNEDGDLTFAHWNMQDGQHTTIRFLPDANPENTFFWRERQQINLTFPGIKGQDENKNILIRVPCVEMWNESCPILNEVRPWWKDASLVEMARKYWKKRSYLMQGFVVDTPIQEDNTPDNPIRKFIMTPQIFNIIKAALLDPEMEYVPTDYENGVNFTISRTTKGGFNDYSTSKYARRETPLTDEQRKAIDEHGLFDLGNWMPAKPDAETLTAIHEMFEASVNGDLYDPDRFAKYYRPFGMPAPGTGGNEAFGTQQAKPAPQAQAPAPQQAAAPAQASPAPAPQATETTEAAAPAASGSAKDILAKIRSRQSA